MKTKTSFTTFNPARILCTCFAVAIAGMALTVQAAQGPPERMTYQGFLVQGDAAKTPMGNDEPVNKDIIFSIFEEQGSEEVLWAEQQTVTIDKGYFSVLLGEGTDARSVTSPALSAVFSGGNSSERFIEITVKDLPSDGVNTPILPRLKLVASPYAFLSTRAQILMDDNGDDMVTVEAGVGINVEGAVTATEVNATTVSGNGSIPVGGIIMWSGTSIPAGWAICNGGTVNGVRTPNLRDRFIVGSGSSYSVGSTGGASTVTLSQGQMPAHDHDVWTRSGDGAHEHTAQRTSRADNDDNDTPGNFIGDPNRNYYSSYDVGRITSGGSAHQHYVDTPSRGSSQAHENKPPYYALAFIMRVQ